MTQKRYFGTDGIRGAVGKGVITPEFMLKLGWAAGRVFSERYSGQHPKILIGKDTRISGYMFESALEAGLSAAGVDVALLGPMPTPAVAYLTRTFRACAGIVISASHNPFYDNGIKFFSEAGEKLPDEVELAIEAHMDMPLDVVESGQLGKATRIADAAGRYIEFCKSTVPSSFRLNGVSIVLDCAHGATYHIAPSVFEELGATVMPLSVKPDGLNINKEVGSTKPGLLSNMVKDQQVDLGIAFDGDGDRVIMVDHNGRVVDGDELIFIIAKNRHSDGRLRGGVVGTLMTNFGVELALEQLDIPFARAKVGDRYVMEMLNRKNWILGGEGSGHIVCRDTTTTGDGIVSALQVLFAMSQANKPLADLAEGLQMLPQKMINVRFAEKRNIVELPAVKDAVDAASERLANQGRVLLRPSGTEPVIRVMAEGVDENLVESVVTDLAAVVRDVAG